MMPEARLVMARINNQRWVPWSRSLVGVTGGKTLSERIFSELAQIADIVESAGSPKCLRLSSVLRV